jgi:hypothetical protein
VLLNRFGKGDAIRWLKKTYANPPTVPSFSLFVLLCSGVENDRLNDDNKKGKMMMKI